MSDKKTGTREWAEATSNIAMGCSHGCRYCYARHMICTRYKKCKVTEWKKMTVNQKKVDAPVRKYNGMVMFPSSHDITPESIQKEVTPIFDFGYEPDDNTWNKVAETAESYTSIDDIDKIIKGLESEMQQAAKNLEFEKAAELRDQIKELQKLIVLEI